MSNFLELPVSIKLTDPLPVSFYYGPWSSESAAIANIPAPIRYLGLTAGIIGGNGVIAEYWWPNGLADGDLVVKTTGGGSSGGNVIDALPDYIMPSTTTTTTGFTSSTTTSVYPLVNATVTVNNPQNLDLSTTSMVYSIIDPNGTTVSVNNSFSNIGLSSILMIASGSLYFNVGNFTFYAYPTGGAEGNAFIRTGTIPTNLPNTAYTIDLSNGLSTSVS